MHKRVIAVLLSGALLLAACPPVTVIGGEQRAEGQSRLYIEARDETESEPYTESESEAESEPCTEGQSEPESEPSTEGESEPESEACTEEQSEAESEAYTESESEAESEPYTEGESEPESEPYTERQSEACTEGLNGAESEPYTEGQSEAETQTEQETETETEEWVDVDEWAEDWVEDWSAQEPAVYPQEDGNTYLWDPSWYIDPDYRFTQVAKRYVLAEGAQSIAVYDAPDMDANVVGALPYFGLAYLLEETDEQWVYVESGEVRGFIQREQLSEEQYAEEVTAMIGEDSFSMAVALCEKADNAAFTYTHTTVQEVLAPKRYALLIQSAAIYEYPQTDARTIAEAGSGTLVYILVEQAGEAASENGAEDWVYVESGDARGFMKSEVLLKGATAADVVGEVGEEQMCLASALIDPEENRSCYYTLASVNLSLASDTGIRLVEYALGFVGKLPYVWGGTSLTDGADCSGFVQSIYAAFGINLPRLAQDQGSSGIEVMGLQEAQQGDVIYWSSGPHVGIYIGNGMAVHCTGSRNNTVQNPGRGVTVSAADYQPITSIRRYIIQTDTGSASADRTPYTKSQLELIWAIVAQEDNGSYDGALAVISSAMNRTESAKWGYCGSNALSQLTASGQYCYSMDSYWKARLNGNVPEYVKQAVNDCLKKGLRNHSYTCFRSRKGSQTGADAVQIGGNWYFGT